MAREKSQEPLFNEAILARCKICKQSIAFTIHGNEKRFAPHTKPLAVENRFETSRPRSEVARRPCAGSDMPVRPEEEIKI